MAFLAEGFLQLLSDPAHWILEGVSEVVFFVIEVIILDRLFHWDVHRNHQR